MGASGAGKTSLLNIISQRARTTGNMKLTGRVTYNDVTVSPQLQQEYQAYVTQDDVLFKYFTVLEALTFTARLKLSKLTTEV